MGIIEQKLQIPIKHNKPKEMIRRVQPQKSWKKDRYKKQQKREEDVIDEIHVKVYAAIQLFSCKSMVTG